MAQKRGLGKGLDSLIPNSVLKPMTVPVSSEKTKQVVKNITEASSEDTHNRETLVKLVKIEPNKEQPRKNFEEVALKELAESIRQYGVLSPILVQQKEDRYVIIAGERRWRAAKLAGLKEVPVIIRNYTEREIAEISLIENVQREDLNPIEEAMGYKRLIEEFGLKQEEVAECVSKSRSAIANALRLLKLSERIQAYLINGGLSMGHARALLAVEDIQKQEMLAEKIVKEKLSVREVEKLVRTLDKTERSKSVVDQRLKMIYADYEEQLKQALGTKVTITPSQRIKGAGKFEIEFYSTEDFERILERMMRD